MTQSKVPTTEITLHVSKAQWDYDRTIFSSDGAPPTFHCHRYRRPTTVVCAQGSAPRLHLTVFELASNLGDNRIYGRKVTEVCVHKNDEAVAHAILYERNRNGHRS